MMATEVLSASLGNSNSMDGDSRGSRVAVQEPKERRGENELRSSMPGNRQHAPNNTGHQKKPHRRTKKKRKWKPYSKMSWEERKAMEEKEKSKAVRMREEMKEKGRPVAPYNTTQFLMDEHDPYDGGFEPPGYNNSNVSAPGTDEGESYSDDQDDMNGSIVSKDDDGIEEPMGEYTDSPHMVPEFISQDFSETYERVHEESLNTMTKEELLAEHIDLEKKFSQLQEQVAKTSRSHSNKINALEARIEELESEKAGLLSENERLLLDLGVSKSRKSESRMSTSDTEDVESNSLEKINTLIQGEVMERR